MKSYYGGLIAYNALSNGTKTILDPIGPPVPQDWGYGFATPTQTCNLKFWANEC